MPKSFPEHRKIFTIWTEPNDMFNADPLGISALKPVGNAQRTTPAFAFAAQEALIPTAWCQLIPNKGCDAA